MLTRLLAGLGLALLVGAAAAAPSRGVIVRLRDDAAPVSEARRHAQAVLQRAGLRPRRDHHLGGGLHRLDFAADDEATRDAALAQLRAQPDVLWAVPNEREHRLTVPQDPLFAATLTSSGQWWLFPSGGSNGNVIDDRRRGVPGIQTAWSTIVGAATVAVLDTGITAHPDLNAHVLPGRDFVSTVEYANDGDGWDDDPSDPGDWVSAADRSANKALFGDCELQDSSWHGTIIAGLLAGVSDNGVGITSIGRTSDVLPVRVAGKCGADVADILAGMRWAAGLPVYDANDRLLPTNPHPARVLNISFGSTAACNAAYQDTIDELTRAGVLVVAAAGNDSAAPTRPATCRGVLGVAALNRDGFKSSYSNFGPGLDIATVGGDPRMLGEWGLLVGDDALLTVSNAGRTSPGGPGYGRAAGTSFAAPVAAGVAAMMLAVNPQLSAEQLILGVRTSARPHVTSPYLHACDADNSGRCACTTQTCGAGILDAPQALLYAAMPGVYVPPARQPEVIDTPELAEASAGGPDRPTSGSGEPSAGGGGAVDATWLGLLAVAVLSCRRARSRGPACPSGSR